MVIDTGSGFSLVRRNFVERCGLSILRWEGPSALLVSGQLFAITECCHIMIELLETQIWNSFGLVETFPLDICLGRNICAVLPF